MDHLNQFNDYLPRYRFPRMMQLSCGCFALFLTVAGLFIFLIIPHIFAYIVTLDEYPLLELQPNGTIQLDDFTLTLSNIQNDTRCLHHPNCSAIGQVDLVFTTSLGSQQYPVTFNEAQDASDPLALPQGYLLRVMSISADHDYLVQLQVFQLPPTSGS